MGPYPKAIGLSLVLLAAISSHGVSDTTSETQPSIEWLVYKSDAIVIGKLVERSDGEIREAVYQVSEVLMPHAQVNLGDKLRADDNRDEVGDQAVLFLAQDGARPTPFHVSSLARAPTYKYTHYAHLRFQSDPITWYGIDEWGILIDSPETLKRKIKQLIGTPWADRLKCPLVKREETTEIITWRIPTDWEYENEGGYDVIMEITIPPTRVPAWQQRPTQETIGSAETTSAEKRLLTLARQMRDKQVERFAYAQPEDPTLGKKCSISPNRKYVLAEQSVRPDEIRLLYELDVEKRILTLQNAAGNCSFSPSGKFFWYRLRQAEESVVIRLLDLSMRRVVFQAEDSGYRGWHGNWTFNKEETRIGCWHNTLVSGEHEAVIWDIESGKELFRNTGDFLELTPGDQYVVLRQKDKDSELRRRLFEILGGDLVLTLPEARFVISGDDRLYAYTEKKMIDRRSEDRTVIVRQLPNDELVRRYDFDEPIWIDQFLDDDRSLAIFRWSSPLSTSALGHAAIVDTLGDDERPLRVQFAKPN